MLGQLPRLTTSPLCENLARTIAVGRGTVTLDLAIEGASEFTQKLGFPTLSIILPMVVRIHVASQ